MFFHSSIFLGENQIFFVHRKEFTNMKEEHNMDNKYFDLLSDAYEAELSLKNTQTALSNIIDANMYEFTPSIRLAYLYATSNDDERKSLDRDAELSYKWFTDMKNTLWLVNIALDYCYNAMEILQKMSGTEEK